MCYNELTDDEKDFLKQYQYPRNFYDHNEWEFSQFVHDHPDIKLFFHRLYAPGLQTYQVQCKDSKGEVLYDNNGYIEMQDLDLRDSNFSESNLVGSTIQFTDLDGSEFKFCDLREIDFCGYVSLKSVKFEYGQLTRAKFGWLADLEKAQFYSCDLSGADFSEAENFNAISFNHCNLKKSIFKLQQDENGKLNLDVDMQNHLYESGALISLDKRFQETIEENWVNYQSNLGSNFSLENLRDELPCYLVRIGLDRTICNRWTLNEQKQLIFSSNT